MPQSIPQHASDTSDVELAFELAGVGLCIARERVIKRCNRAFAEMFGYTAEQLTGRSLECLYPSPEEYENTGQRGFPIMQKTGSYSDERIMRKKDGSLFWCHVVGRSLSREAPYACAVWSFEDISVKRPVAVQLTGREREVAQLLIEGKSSKEIARVLDISSRTVEAHRARLLRKFEVKTVVELISRLVGFT